MTYFNIYFGDRCRGPSGNLSVPQNEQNYRKERNKDCTWQEVDGKKHDCDVCKNARIFSNPYSYYFFNNSVGFRQGS